MQNLCWMRQQDFRRFLRDNLDKIYVYAIGVEGYYGISGITPKYIGKGKRFRALSHLCEIGGKPPLRRVHRGLIKWAPQVRYAIVSWCASDRDALDLEVNTIRYYGRDALWNLTDGGEGAANPSAETLRKRSAAQKITFSSAKSKARMSRRSKAMWDDEECRERMIAARRSKAADPMWIEKMRRVTKAAFGTPEIRAIRRRVAVEVNSRPDVKAKIAAHSKAMWQKEEYRDRMSDARKKMWEAEKHRENTMASMREAAARPEVKKKVADASKRNWANPEHAAMMSGKRKEMWKSPEYRRRICELRGIEMAKPERRAAASLNARIRGMYAKISGLPYRNVKTTFEAKQYLVDNGYMTPEGMFT